MAEHFSKPTRGEVPGVPGPDPLGMVTSSHLPDHRLYAPALLHQPVGPGVPVVFPGLEGGDQPQPLGFQFLGQGGAPVVYSFGTSVTCPPLV